MIEFKEVDVMKFFDKLSSNHDEWWGREDRMTVECICEFLDYIGQEESAYEIRQYIKEQCETK